MKRSEPLRADPAKTRAWQQRSRERQRAAAPGAPVFPGPRPAPSKRRSSSRPRQPPYWTGEIRGTLCVVCERRPAVHAHHIITLQRLRLEAARLGYELADVRYDRRNRLGVCRTCHERHHNRSRPIARAVLDRVASWVFDFARKLGLEYVLDREYPQVAASPRTGDAAPA